MSAVVIIDYQNIHLTGHERFCPSGLARHESLLHPLHFANQAIHARAAAMRSRDMTVADVELGRVVAFRGLPGNRQQPEAYRRNLAQQSEWTKDPRIRVVHRPLRYYYDHSGYWTAQEKGVDVLAAIELVKAVDDGENDVVVLASTTRTWSRRWSTPSTLPL